MATAIQLSSFSPSLSLSISLSLSPSLSLSLSSSIINKKEWEMSDGINREVNGEINEEQRVKQRILHCSVTITRFKNTTQLVYSMYRICTLFHLFCRSWWRRLEENELDTLGLATREALG
eukprot:sb/3476143/